MGAPVSEAVHVPTGTAPDPGWKWTSFLGLAAPMIVSRAGLAAMTIADAVMVSRYSAKEFAAFSLAGGTLGRVMDVFGAFVMGGLVLIPRALGAGEARAGREIWRRSIGPAVTLGAAATVISCFGKPLLMLLGESADLSASAGNVAVLLGFGFVPGLMALCAAIYLEGMKRPMLVAVSVIAANVANIGLNWLLIGGHAGAVAMGARGSALSTSIVRLALAFVLVGCVMSQKIEWSPMGGRANSDGRTQFKLGLSAAAVQGTLMILASCLTLFAGWLGPMELATLAAVFTLNAPAMLVSLGMGDAASIQVASEDGRGTLGRPRLFGFTSLGATTFAMLLFAAAACLLPGALATSFTRDPRMHAGLTALIPLGACLLVFDGASVVMAGALRALRDIAWPVGIEIGSMALLVPAAAYLAFQAGYGVRGLLLAALLSAFCRAAFLIWRFEWFTQPRERRLQDFA